MTSKDSSPLEEADFCSLNEEFARDPLGMTDAKVDLYVEALQAQRRDHAAGIKKKRATKAKGPVPSMDELLNRIPT